MLLATFLLALFAASAAAAPKAPKSFVGMMVDGPVTLGPLDLDEQVAGMRRAGVGHIRFVVYWDTAQPYATFDEVPRSERNRFVDVGGVPTDFSESDRLVGAAARQRLEVTAVVLRAPEWARAEPPLKYSPPSETVGRQAYADFLTALVERYGTGGTFFAERPYFEPRPVTLWQIWNEPQPGGFWDEDKVRSRYADLLRAAYPAVKRADPKARVVAAGFFGFSWKLIAGMYRQGAQGFFDVAAVHPFTARPVNMIEILRRVRRVMRRNGDARKQLLISELSWPSSKGKATYEPAFVTDERGQAQRVTGAYRMLAANRREMRLLGAIWSTWATYDRFTEAIFDYAGLFSVRDGKLVPKPAFAAFRAIAKAIT